MTYQDINVILSHFEGDKSISDIHIKTQETISYRKVGSIEVSQEFEKPTREDMELFAKQLLQNYPNGRERLMQQREIDLNFYSKAQVPYRVNIYFTLEKIGIAMRKISYKPLPLHQILYDDIADSILQNVLNQKTGLFLVTGPTGSGKTTSLIAMLEWLNIHRKEHIITIEDPIEFIFEPKNCLVSQRELGSDTLDFAHAMRSAMRQDPDIIFVGEIRDPETADAAMKLAETGHLVFSTLHTRNAADTVYRFVSLFPPEIQDNARDRLAAGLIGIQSQFLLKTKDGKGRIGLFELMINTTAVKNDIRKNDGKQINSIIETSRQRGMISHHEYAKRLLADGLISKESVDWLFE